MKMVLLLLLFLSGCKPEMMDWYRPSDPEAVKAFLIKYNILRLNCNGEINQEATTYALIEWSRLNFVHAEGDLKLNGKSVMGLIREGEKNGHVIIDGCQGAGSFYKHVLGAVGIKLVTDVIELSKGHFHGKIDFPFLGKTSLHADRLYSESLSSVTELEGSFDVPSSEILAPITLGQEGTSKQDRMFEEDLFLTFKPQFNIFYRALMGGYGKYFTEKEIEDNDNGKINLNDRHFGNGALLSTNVLKKLDSEIDRLGGVESTIKLLEGAIITQDKKTQLKAVNPAQIFANECPLPTPAGSWSSGSNLPQAP